MFAKIAIYHSRRHRLYDSITQTTTITTFYHYQARLEHAEDAENQIIAMETDSHPLYASLCLRRIEMSRFVISRGPCVRGTQIKMR